MDKLQTITILICLVINQLSANPVYISNTNDNVRDLENSESSLSASGSSKSSSSSISSSKSQLHSSNGDFGNKPSASQNSDSYTNSDYSNDYYNDNNKNNDYDHGSHDGPPDIPSRPHVETGFRPYSGKPSKKTKKTVILAIPVKLALKIPENKSKPRYVQGQRDDYNDDNSDYRSNRNQNKNYDENNDETGEVYAASRPPKREQKKKISLNKIIKGLSNEYELASPLDIATLYNKPTSLQAQQMISTFVNDYIKPNDQIDSSGFKLKANPPKGISAQNILSYLYPPPLAAATPPLVITYPAYSGVGGPMFPLLPYQPLKKPKKKKGNKLAELVLTGASTFKRPFKVFSRSKGDKPSGPLSSIYTAAASSPTKFYLPNKPKLFHPGLDDFGFGLKLVTPLEELLAASSSLIPTFMKPQQFQPVKPNESKVLSFYKKFF